VAAYTDADVQALMSFLAREGIACGPKLSDRILDQITPAIVARAKAEAWDEGFSRGFYDPLAGSAKDASESRARNPYETERT